MELLKKLRGQLAPAIGTAVLAVAIGAIVFGPNFASHELAAPQQLQAEAPRSSALVAMQR